MRKKRPVSMDDKRRMEALNQAKEIRMKRGRNPRMAAQPLKSNVESEMGNPGGTSQSRLQKNRAAKVAMDKFVAGKFDKLPRLSEAGGPVGLSSELNSESGNPGIKRSKSKYGL